MQCKNCYWLEPLESYTDTEKLTIFYCLIQLINTAKRPDSLEQLITLAAKLKSFPGNLEFSINNIKFSITQTILDSPGILKATINQIANSTLTAQ